jgi:hypothetical protein
MATGEELTDRFRKLQASLEALPEVTEPPKPMLRILGFATDERKWNKLLAYFLDPSQPHGFGADLLKSFLDKAGEVTDEKINYYHRDIERVSVETEVRSPQNNQLDILIRAPDEWFVCIESKVDSPEGDRQTEQYAEDTHIGNERKNEYPKDGQYYLFLSKKYASDSSAYEFEDISWRDVVDAFQTKLNFSHGQYPNRSVNQLKDFLSTIITVTNMKQDDDDFEQIQRKKIQLLGEYRDDIDELSETAESLRDQYKDDIDELFEAAESLRGRAIEQWPDLFFSQVDQELWTDEWQIYRETKKWGTIFKNGWWLDGENLEPTSVRKETEGGLRLYFNHLIRNEESFNRGQLTYRLRARPNSQLRDEFYQLYKSPRWQKELEPLLDERGITNIGNKRRVMRKRYDVDQAGLPESYFETLAVAFEQHIPIAEIIDDIVNEAISNIED